MIFLSGQPPDLSNTMLWKIVLKCMQEIPRRRRLMDVNSIDDVIAQLRRASKIVVVTGAGVSESPSFMRRVITSFRIRYSVVQSKVFIQGNALLIYY